MIVRSSQSPPEIAVIGHPNEGKSSVLSTLAEDDSIRVSPTPGETTECQTFPVIIDGREVLRFTDTPGFQNPGRVLSELRKLAESGSDCLAEFRRNCGDIKELHDDIELLLPVERGAGIIYVVDGSRPVRNVDRAEMEILRLTGRPRMAIINCKDDNFTHLASWKNEFRQNFNANRVFNAHRATYAERILLLEALQSIDQDWQPILAEVVTAFKKDWASRNSMTVDILLALLDDCLSYHLVSPTRPQDDTELLRQQLAHNYCQTIVSKEQEAHKKIRALFKHNIFQYQLPQHSILHEDLFDEKTWHLLGLTKKQLTLAGSLGGAALGAGLDLAAGGITFGVFTTLGGAAGALGALLGGEKLSKEANFLGIQLGGEQIQVGPNTNIALLFILINRTLLYYRHTINWAHGRRDYDNNQQTSRLGAGSEGFTRNWPAGHLRTCKSYFSAITENNVGELQKLRQDLRVILEAALLDISQSD